MSRYCKCVNVDSCDGNEPDSGLLPKSSSVNAVNVEIVDGTVPVSEFEFRFKDDNPVDVDSPLGMDPLSWLLCKSTFLCGASAYQTHTR